MSIYEHFQDIFFEEDTGERSNNGRVENMGRREFTLDKNMVSELSIQFMYVLYRKSFL